MFTNRRYTTKTVNNEIGSSVQNGTRARIQTNITIPSIGEVDFQSPTREHTAPFRKAEDRSDRTRGPDKISQRIEIRFDGFPKLFTTDPATRHTRFGRISTSDITKATTSELINFYKHAVSEKQT